MTAAEAVIARLKAVSAVTAIVASRVYNVKLPQSPTLPAIRVQRISDTEEAHLRGGVQYFRTRVQVDAVTREGSGYDHVAVATALDAAMVGDRAGSGLAYYRGSFGSPAFVVDVILPDTAREGYDAVELNEFRVMRDYIVMHRG